MTRYFERPLSEVTTTWKIYHEESAYLNPRDERTDFEELRGVHDTRIYRHGQNEFAVSTDNPRWQTKLREMPGLTPKNWSVYLFPDALLDTVAEAIHAERRRQYSPEYRQVLRERAQAMTKSRIGGSKTDDLPQG